MKFNEEKQKTYKVAFIDRDGTIIKDYPDLMWSDIENPEFLEGSLEGMKNLSELNYKLIIITNQYIINSGIITEKKYQTFQEKVLNKLIENDISLLDTFYCPHTDDENCDCKKPKTGLVKKALEKYPNIDLKKSIVIGDSPCDAYLTKNLNLPAFIIGNKCGNIDQEIFIRFDSIKEVADYLNRKR